MHGVRLVTLLAERRSAPWCVADSREVSSRQPVGEWRLAGKALAFARFPTIGGLLPKDARFTYGSVVVCLLGTMTPPNRSDFLYTKEKRRG